ncbi:hypothetical protein BANRA_02780 [Acinetobacter baumannii]|nr:hypothetical protein BANRA_02780 [Acinetobacter baumannii]
MSNKTKYIAAVLAASAAFCGRKNDEGFTSKPVIPVKGIGQHRAMVLHLNPMAHQ